MKIVIGFNSFSPGTSQYISLDSWKYLVNEGFVNDIYDLQFADEQIINHDSVITDFCLKRSSQDLLTGSVKKLPVVRDAFDALSDKIEPDDYFIFTNNDIIINKNLIKHIIEQKPECFACSRVNIQHINSFNDIKQRKVTPIKYEIYGFDTFIVKKRWWIANQHIFNDYLLGMPVYDSVFACLMKIFGGNHDFGNDTPPFCFHIDHDPTWQLNGDAPERRYNHNVCENNHLDRLCFNILGYWNKSYLIRREPVGRFFNKITNEKKLESSFFETFQS